MTSRVTVEATRWELGWELTLNTGGVTQTRTLATAVQQVRDYLDTIHPEIDHSTWDIDVMPQIGPVLDQARQAQAASETARQATKEAAAMMRQAVSALRATGLSMSDTASILGVSKGRISQLAA